MVGDTWITDMTHFIEVLDPSAEVPSPTRNIGMYFGRIVEAATSLPVTEPVVSEVRCRRRPRRKPCSGRIRVVTEPGAGSIRWSCTHCDDKGIISAWSRTPWDRTAAGGTLRRPEHRRASALAHQDVLSLIRSAFPDGAVEVVPDPDQSYLAEILDQLRDRISCIDRATLLYERPPVPEPQWSEDSDPEEDPPDLLEFASSYHLFFVAGHGEPFDFETQAEFPDEEGNLGRVSGRSRLGWCVAVSLIAPVVIISLSEMESYGDGSEVLPDIQQTRFQMDGSPLRSEEYLDEFLDQTEIRTVQKLAQKIQTVLRSLMLTLLSEEEAQRGLPWLRVGEDTLCGGGCGEGVTVFDALFFREP